MNVLEMGREDKVSLRFLAILAPSCAAISSSRGIVGRGMGAILDLASTRRDILSAPVPVTRYAAVKMARDDASAKTTRVAIVGWLEAKHFWEK